MAAPGSPTVLISQCSGTNAFRIKGHFDATGEVSCGKPVYRKRDGEYYLHFWGDTAEWMVSGGADFKDRTGRSWAVLENSPNVHAALSRSEWHVIPCVEQSKRVQAFAYAV
jgi:hypothetical protein